MNSFRGDVDMGPILTLMYDLMGKIHGISGEMEKLNWEIQKRKQTGLCNAHASKLDCVL